VALSFGVPTWVAMQTMAHAISMACADGKITRTEARKDLDKVLGWAGVDDVTIDTPGLLDPTYPLQHVMRGTAPIHLGDLDHVEQRELVEQPGRFCS